MQIFHLACGEKCQLLIALPSVVFLSQLSASVVIKLKNPSNTSLASFVCARLVWSVVLHNLGLILQAP
jgi:hypothetical protein